MIDRDTRDRLMAEPERILEDRDLMAALISANERALGANIVDLRGIAMERLEARLDRLEDTHRSVVAAAYENLAGTNQVHRAVLKLLEPTDFEGFLACLAGDVAAALRVDSLRLVLESHEEIGVPGLGRHGKVLHLARPGFVYETMTVGRGNHQRPVVLRQAMPESQEIHGEAAGFIQSEALLRLDLGARRLPGMLALGAEDSHMFHPGQGADLLTFFGQVFERLMQRWLA